MHSPIKYATDQLLTRHQGIGLDEWLRQNADMPTSLLLVQLTNATDGIVVVDRRTVMRWRKNALAPQPA